jgi:hypothetical protein
MIDTVTTQVNPNTISNTLVSNNQIIDISNIPINKWFHLAIRCQNKNIDIYINGVIYNRTILNQPPRQNSDSIYVCDATSPKGSISDLRYFNYALSVVDINNILMAGPNISLYAGYSKSSSEQGGDYSKSGSTYLANTWYNRY